MARTANPLNAAGRGAQQRYRVRLAAKRQPEVPIVDTAVAVAVAVYGHRAREIGSAVDVQRFDALEDMAANFLVSRGFDRHEAERRVHVRLNRIDVQDLVPRVRNAPKVSTGPESYSA